MTRKLIGRAKAGGCKVIALTVDAPQLGRRQKDMQNKFTETFSGIQYRDQGLNTSITRSSVHDGTDLL